MKASDVRAKTADQLSDELASLKKEQFNLRFQKATGQIEKTHRVDEVRMGSGKGAPELWVARVKPGRIMFELDGVSEATAREALGLGAAKLPIKTRIVRRQA